jgi:exonuclease SbcC
MIPSSLKLTNFGAIPEAEIDLHDISLAAVVGPNGVGKSTLFTTAPMWALFGVGRGGGSDDVVRSGEAACSVTFDFEHRGEEYRVVRTRSTTGRGKSTLELQKSDGAGSVLSLSGTTIRETEEKIQALLHLDAETFAASSMILQGRANEFTAKAPGQRKAILTQILGLEVYDRLQEGAKKRVAESQRTLDRFSEAIARGRPKIDELSLAAEDLALKETELQHIDAQVSELETRILEARQKLFDADAKWKKAEEMKARGEELQAKRQALVERRREYEAVAREADEFLKNESTILLAAQEYEDAKERLAVVREKSSSLEKVRARYRELAGEREALSLEFEKCVRSIKAIELELTDRESIESAAREAEELAPRVERDAQDAAALHELEKRRAELKTRIGEIINSKGLLTQRIKTCEEKAERLSQSGCVALGQAELTPCRFLQDAIDAKNGLPALRGKLGSVEDESPLSDEARDIEERIALLGYDPKIADDRHRHLKALRVRAEKIHELKGKEALLKVHQQRKSELLDRTATLAASMNEVAEEGKNLLAEVGVMADIETRMEKLYAHSRKKDELPAMREKHENASAEATRLEKEIDELQDRIYEIDQEVDILHLAPVEIIRQNLSDLENERDRIRPAAKSLVSEIGVLRAKLAEAEKLKAEIEELERERAPLAKTLTRWETLAKAFGRNGIPAFIIENAVPELERISNEILGQMSNGRHSLRLETQRDLKSKTGVAETLDIIVSDWQGARPYETFSGGEQMRVDLAIRIGLAELLASRAGNKIEWLVIDEGLGSQDDEHRETVLQAIQSVAPRFRRTMVITHIKEAQGVFPQVIELSRSDDGLKVRVA